MSFTLGALAFAFVLAFASVDASVGRHSAWGTLSSFVRVAPLVDFSARSLSEIIPLVRTAVLSTRDPFIDFPLPEKKRLHLFLDSLREGKAAMHFKGDFSPCFAFCYHDRSQRRGRSSVGHIRAFHEVIEGSAILQA